MASTHGSTTAIALVGVAKTILGIDVLAHRGLAASTNNRLTYHPDVYANYSGTGDFECYRR